MGTARLEQLGLKVRVGGPGLEVSLALRVPLLNPVNHRLLDQVAFRLEGEQLVPIAPQEVVGLPSITLSLVRDAGDVESKLSDTFNEHLFHVQRRSSELLALGLSPQVSPDTLLLSTQFSDQGLQFALLADREGNFRLVRAVRDGEELPIAGGYTFELSEFRERGALVGYLAALLSELMPSEPSRTQPALPEEQWVRFSDIAAAFGPGALVPPRSGLEVLTLLQVEGKPYRFAAARVVGRTFRGMLAGAKGKVWAGRFELDDFPGIVPLVASLLKVPSGAVVLIGADEPQE